MALRGLSPPRQTGSIAQSGRALKRFAAAAVPSVARQLTASAARPQQNYLGEPNRSPNIGGWFEVLGTFNAGEYLRIPLNLGYKTSFRQDIPSLSIGNQLTFGGALQVLLGQERFMLTAEAFGRTAAASGTGFGGSQESPIELLGGFKYLHPKGFAVGIAGTGGVTSGYGNPDWRLIGMLGYTMRNRSGKDGVKEFLFVLGQPLYSGAVQAIINPIGIR